MDFENEKLQGKFNYEKFIRFKNKLEFKIQVLIYLFTAYSKSFYMKLSIKIS